MFPQMLHPRNLPGLPGDLMPYVSGGGAGTGRAFPVYRFRNDTRFGLWFNNGDGGQKQYIAETLPEIFDQLRLLLTTRGILARGLIKASKDPRVFVDPLHDNVILRAPENQRNIVGDIYTGVDRTPGIGGVTQITVEPVKTPTVAVDGSTTDSGGNSTTDTETADYGSMGVVWVIVAVLAILAYFLMPRQR